MFLILSVVSAVIGSSFFSGESIMKPLLLVDLDDTLYFDDRIIYKAVGDLMDEYCSIYYDLSSMEVTEMCREHSSAANGLKVIKKASKKEINKFLWKTHSVSLDHIKFDARLKEFFLFLSKRVEMFIFTAGPWFHARRILFRLGLDEIFPKHRVIDIRSTDFKSKYFSSTFDEALRIVRDQNVQFSDVYFVDDSLKNVQVATSHGGITSIWIDQDGSKKLTEEDKIKGIRKIADLTELSEIILGVKWPGKKKGRKRHHHTKNKHQTGWQMGDHAWEEVYGDAIQADDDASSRSSSSSRNGGLSDGSSSLSSGSTGTKDFFNTRTQFPPPASTEGSLDCLIPGGRGCSC